MRVRHSKTAIPRSFSRLRYSKGRIVAEGDITIKPHGRLTAKVIIFKHPTALRQFWGKFLGNPLGRGTLGVVNTLGITKTRFTTGKPDYTWMEVDPRYFCVMGLCLGHLNMEVITHESTHVGFAYAKRMGRRLWAEVGELDEEEVAYPSGVIASAINRYLRDKGLYKD